MYPHWNRVSIQRGPLQTEQLLVARKLPAPYPPRIRNADERQWASVPLLHRPPPIAQSRAPGVCWNPITVFLWERAVENSFPALSEVLIGPLRLVCKSGCLSTATCSRAVSHPPTVGSLRARALSKHPGHMPAAFGKHGDVCGDISGDLFQNIKKFFVRWRYLKPLLDISGVFSDFEMRE